MNLVLGIESSCDETAAAIVSEDGVVWSNVVRSQIALHRPYGGVVPELAARDHLTAIQPVVRAALEQASMSLSDVAGIAVTNRPGLMGALLVGLQAAKGLAWAANKPLVGVDHLVGHLLSVHLHARSVAHTNGRDQPSAATVPAPPMVTFPAVGLLVSGGHTGLYVVPNREGQGITELGATRDDAAGEAYDKVAKLLGLSYPGGPVIDRLAKLGDSARSPVSLKVALPQKTSFEFSFSGLKSAVARHVEGPNAPRTDQEVKDLCAAFQRIVVKTLVTKTIRAAQHAGVKDILIAGGVSANSQLRATMKASCEKRGLSLHLPSLKYCTDNAAMIAYAGNLSLQAGRRDGFDLAPMNRTSLPRLTRKGKGPRRR